MSRSQHWIGVDKPQVIHTKDDFIDSPGWWIGKLHKEAKKENLLFDEFVDKYQISPNPDDYDLPEAPHQNWEEREYV